MKNGCFIVFEGPDGSGKTTICDIVCQKLTDMGFEIVHTREPGGIEIAEKIRNIILDPLNTAMDAKTEALLYAASRRQHLVEKVIPSLKENKIVICERFVYSSLAYQGKARGIGYEGIMAINDFVSLILLFILMWMKRQVMLVLIKDLVRIVWTGRLIISII